MQIYVTPNWFGRAFGGRLARNTLLALFKVYVLLAFVFARFAGVVYLPFL